MKRYLCSYIVPLLVLLTACTAPEKPIEPVTQLKAVTLDNRVKIIGGQTVYVPIYSHIYIWERGRTMELTSTLSVRNTDLTHPIIIASVNYYDSNGKLVRKYLKQPVELPRLASTNFIVDQEDTSGGAGASFIVEWVTQKQVSVPVIEAVMINASGNQGVSLVSPGRVIKTRTNTK
ncbi:DUF3124 domain-containing protein [Aerosakkonemataceae cyanobacterium BLCC-F50]|uniref:DUF3124 domain-containing protein n=1 Tax=Floridaenema flaviceps BLCC-F50 TaxID=3153642 RepID=A0ABV4XUV5_9CYAN